MAEHKAPTQVVIAPTEENAFKDFVDRYWKLAAGITLAIAAVVVFRQISAQKSAETEGSYWQTLEAVANPVDAEAELPSGADLRQVADQLQGTDAGAWARALEAAQLLEERDFDGASAAIEKLKRDYPDHPLVTTSYKVGTSDENQSIKTLPDNLAQAIVANRQLEARLEHLRENPPLPEDAPRVRLNTSEGSIVVGLFEEQAPGHTANFLKLCGEGYYDGTKFHRVLADFMIQGGDPNSKDQGIETWGQGGPGYKQDPEISQLKHFEGVLAAAKAPGDRESSGSQFYITTGPSHHLDGRHTIFGAVLEGLETVEKIESAQVVEGSDRPEVPVTIESTEVL